MEEKSVEMLTFTMSEKQVVGTVQHQDKEGNKINMAKILLPDSGTILRPESQIRKAKEEGKVIFSVPENYEINISYSKKKDGVTEETPKNERYDTVKKKITARQLYDSLAKSENLITITVDAKRLYGKVEKDGKEYMRIGTPDNRTFLRPSEQVKVSKHDPNKAYFALPKNMKTTAGYDIPYVIKLSSVKQEGKGYDETELTSEGLKQLYDDFDAKQRNSEFVNITFSTKAIVQTFNHKETGKEMAWILTPDGQKITRPMDQIRQSEFEEGKSYISLPKKIEVDGEVQDYKICVYRSELKEGVTEDTPKEERYNNTMQEMTAEEIKNLFDMPMKSRSKEANLVHIHLRPEQIRDSELEGMVTVQLPSKQGVDLIFDIYKNKLQQEKDGFDVVYNVDTKVSVTMESKRKNGSKGRTEPSEWTAKDIADVVDYSVGKAPEKEKEVSEVQKKVTKKATRGKAR